MNEQEVIEKDILRIQRKLLHDSTLGKKLKYLKLLKHLPVTLHILKKTSIGKTINVLRKEDNEVGEKAKLLILKWKDVASSEKNSNEHKNQNNNKLAVSHKSKEHSSKDKDSINDDQIKDHESREKNKLSFADMLAMPMVTVKQKRKHLDNSSLKKLKSSSMPCLPDIELPEILPEPVYRPNRTLPIHTESIDVAKRKKDNALSLSQIVSRKSRSQMYSGKRASTGVVTSLHQQCMRVLIENVDSLYDTGGVPFVILEPLLAKCTPVQLERLEEYNPYFVEDSSILWKTHCQHEFKGYQPKEMESWHEMYIRMSDEREEHLKRLSSKITAAQAAKIPERSVKLAYVAGAPKPSMQMLRKQKKYGTSDNMAERKKELRERIDKEQRNSAVHVPFSQVPRRDRCSVRPPSSLSTTSRNMIPPPRKKVKEDLRSSGPPSLIPSVPKKPAKKPMMVAALKLLKKQKGRCSSQILRR